jgi:hypothetical protein
MRQRCRGWGACDFLQVTDLFLRPLFAFFDTLAEIAQSHACECDTFSNRSLGCAYRCEKRLLLDIRQHI